MKPLSIECPNLTCIINQSWPGCCICCTVVRSHKGMKSRRFWFKKLQRWKSSINIDLRKWVFSSSLFFFLGCFVFGPQLMMIMQHPPFTYLLNKGNVMQTARSQNCNFCNQKVIFLSFCHISKKKSPKKLFCFWAPTNDDHVTSAFYLLTQQRITKLQFLKSSKISKCYFSFFLSHFCTLHSSKTSLIVWTFFFV